MAPATETADAVVRRPPSTYKQHWDYGFFMSLKNEYPGGLYAEEAAALKDEVRLQLDHLCKENNSLALLQLIEDIQRLGLGYIFQEDISKVMNFLVDNYVEDIVQKEASLYVTALYFRLFRQHGFNVSQDVFNIFRDPNRGFKENLGQDIKGMLSLFEASHLALEGDDVLDEGKAFAHRVLSDLKQDIDPNLLDQVARALGLPLHYNMRRLEARWYIDAYSKRKDANTNLLKHAKVAYNMLQGTFREELSAMSRWWSRLGFTEKLPFARDCLIQAYTSVTGMNDEPQHGYCRKGLTKVLSLISVVDDFYDSYATLDEAKLLTDAFDRWDVNEVDGLPDHMKLLFLAVYNTINEFVYDAIREKGLNVLPYYKKMVLMENMKAYMIELTRVKTGYVPTLQEYLKVACRSNLVAILYLYSYVFMSPEISIEILDYMSSYPDIIHWSSMIVRLVDDLGTYQEERERGDNVKAIQCYMNDAGVTEEAARIYISNLFEKTWKKLNAELLYSSLPQATVMMILNTNRVAQVYYQKGDGYGHPDHEMKEKFVALVLNSVPM